MRFVDGLDAVGELDEGRSTALEPRRRRVQGWGPALLN